ncbi:MAG: ABC transporter substrate-binding protein, partial [Anaerolineales bacterium]
MRHLRWQLIIAILGMLLVAGLLAGKGQQGIVEIADEPVRGGVYTEALIGTPHRFNPLLDSANPVDHDIDRLLFSGLTRFDAVGRPTPDLANWIISDDELTYTFVVRADARWHDGQPVTSADVAFTAGLLQDPGFPGRADVAQLWQSVKVKVVNQQTVEFTLPEPFAPFLDYTSFGLLPEHILTGTAAADLPAAAFNSAPVGTGPFKFVGLTGEAGQITGARLAAFDGYRGAAPLLNDVLFKFYPDTAAALAAYQAGEVLGISRIDAAHVDQALALPTLGVYSSLLPQYSLIFLNLQNPELTFFQDKRVRQ